MKKSIDWEKVSKSEGYKSYKIESIETENDSESMFYDLFIIQGVKKTNLSKHIRGVSQSSIANKISEYDWYLKIVNKDENKRICIDCGKFINGENRFRCSTCLSRLEEDFDTNMMEG